MLNPQLSAKGPVALETSGGKKRFPAESRIREALERMRTGTTVVLKAPFEWTKANLCLEAGGVNQNTLHKKRTDGTKKLAHLLKDWDELEAEKNPKQDLEAIAKRKAGQQNERQSLQEQLAAVKSALHLQLQETWTIQKDLVEQQELTAEWRGKFYKVIGKPDPGE